MQANPPAIHNDLLVVAEPDGGILREADQTAAQVQPIHML